MRHQPRGGPYIGREYGVGRGRIDLLLRWPYIEPSESSGKPGKPRLQCEALELKVWATGRPDPLAKGLVQVDVYLNRLQLETGVLVIFDRREGTESAEVRTRFEDARTESGREILVLRG